MMRLYQEHGVNPFGGLIGCLPLIVQLPILTALYYVFTNFGRGHDIATHFLFLANLNQNPNHELMFPGLPIPAITYLIFPLLAAITTFIQSKMLQMPSPPNPTEQELQTLQMQRTMVWISPLMIGYFALNVPAGLGLYWFIGNCVSIIQQSFVVGWGDRKSTRLNSSHTVISYAVFCLKKKRSRRPARRTEFGHAPPPGCAAIHTSGNARCDP